MEKLAGATKAVQESEQKCAQLKKQTGLKDFKRFNFDANPFLSGFAMDFDRINLDDLI